MPQERKVVTVLFADIVDSSATTRSYDAEVLRAALARMFARTREILVAHGATVEKFIGDAVMAVFGVPVAHEDDAERAVRAALALRADVSPNREDGRPGFTLRIGINTGEVVTGDGEGAEFLVTGSPVIVAARLEESAGHGEILVGPLTRELTRGRVQYGPVRTIETKGMGAIEVAAAESLARPGAAAAQAGPFVGREPEMRLLDDMHRRVAATGRPHLVTIYGDAGLGKTRIALEFFRRLDPTEPVARAACLPYGHAITYWPLQELIRGEAEITPTDGRDTARAKIETRVAGMEGLDEQESRGIARELTALALADADTPPSELTSEARRHDLALGMTRYLEARLGSTPGTIVLEDLHWAEEPFLALLEELLEQLRAPLLLLCLARPDLLERRPGWGSGRTNAMAIALEPLDVRETGRLARALLGGASVEPVVDDIIARTEGNPLFVEEYVHMLADEGSRAFVPPTLQGVIAARIDGTTSTVKRLLHEASVLGRDFWLDALPTAHSQTDVSEAERRGLISRRARRGPSGTYTYVFRHGLIRDVAYASLSKAERTRVHDHYSRWLEAAAGERAQEYAEIVAYHAERAFSLANELDPHGAFEIGRRAYALLSRSAAGASARGEFRASRELNDRALEVAAAAGLPAAEQASARALRAIVKLRLDSDFAAVNELDRAIDAARTLGPSAELVRLLVWRASSVTILDDIAESERQFDEAISVASVTKDPEILSYAVWAACEPLGLVGRLAEQGKRLDAALVEIRAAGAPYEVACLGEICINAVARGNRARARAVAEEAIAAAHGTGRRMDRWRAAHALVISLLANDDPRSLSAAEDALALAREIGGPGALAEAAHTSSRARQSAGDLDGARAVLDEAFAQLDPARMTVQRDVIARLETRRAEVALMRGDLETARTSATSAAALAPKQHVEARVEALLAMASVALSEGRSAEAQALLAEANALIAPTEYQELRERAHRIGELVAARAPAR